MFRVFVSILLVVFSASCTAYRSVPVSGSSKVSGNDLGPKGDSEGYYGIIKVGKVYLYSSTADPTAENFEAAIIISPGGQAYHFARSELPKVPSVGEEVSVVGKTNIEISLLSDHTVSFENKVFTDVLTHYTLFSTSARYQGNFGGLASGDSLCASAAASGSKTKLLRGVWKIILSNPTTDAKDRLTAQDGLPIRNTNGEEIVSGVAGLWAGDSIYLFHTIMDENGNFGTMAWTGTGSFGTKGSNHCLSWSSNSSFYNGMTGASDGVGPNWVRIDSEGEPCDRWQALYCINSGG